MLQKMIVVVMGLAIISGCRDSGEVASNQINVLQIKLADMEQKLNETQQKLEVSIQQLEESEVKQQKSALELQNSQDTLQKFQEPHMAIDWNSLDSLGEVHEDLDLNGDGSVVRTAILADHGNPLRISTDAASIAMETDGLDGTFETVQIGKTDKSRQLAFPATGPSGMGMTYFFQYNKDSMIFEYLGVVPGKGDALKITGDGSVITSQEHGAILYTWFHEQTYLLSIDHKLKLMPQDLYLMPPEKLILKINLTLQKSRKASSTGVILKKGEEITLIATDDKEWIQVRTKAGVEAWLALDGYDTVRSLKLPFEDVFDGYLSHAG
ncbi:hypothetical protein EHS13_17955 [Paenibacillus psychroresistens]|uniref:SH3 domain-containing protein n=1 Tax=Paenibacillus psychroresistens TaxID=1778678 RepID=A0A6B8RM66_9BACL|nr:hypothetical protein [Paenibacillus psychroresistens]QGQ96625.1 hypothetical protein EHS13_17955 [Paenibacillus psychroresistens]